MDFIETYLEEISRITKGIEPNQRETIQRAAILIADSIENNGVLHVFGSGHSHMIAEDLFYRAGGLICVNAMLEPSLMEINSGRTTELERLSGYANVLLRGYDLRAGEIIIVVSNSGINAVPIEMAMECQKRGLFVLALTNLDHTSNSTSRHASGKKLHEIADLVLDNGGKYGDAVLSYDGSEKRIGPTSTIGGLIVAQTLIVAVVEELLARGVTPPILESANIEGDRNHNKAMVARYHDRIRYLVRPSDNE